MNISQNNESMSNYVNYITSLWNSNYTNMQNPCTPNFVTGIYQNGTFICGTVEQASESDPYWTANWTLFNQSWTNTFNQTVNDSINNYIPSNNLSIQNYINAQNQSQNNFILLNNESVFELGKCYIYFHFKHCKSSWKLVS